MKPHELFAVAVRVAGLISLIYLLATAVAMIGMGLPWPLVIRAIVLAILSLWLLRGAPQLVRFAYPELNR